MKITLVLLALSMACAAHLGCANDNSSDENPTGKHCSATADAIFSSCGFDVQSEFFKAVAICINISDEADRGECEVDAKASRKEGNEACREQLAGRRDVCQLVGEGRYDPDFDPADFDTDFTTPTRPNLYFPIVIGNRWSFSGGAETNSVEILNETKLIEGLTCVVAQDRVFHKRNLVEDTDDWYCQAKNGNVHYLGEEVKNFESFTGDVPLLPELVNIDGSFKHGREGDKGGLIFSGDPKAGDVYIEEFSLGNAEDVTEILSTTYGFGSDAALDASVPRALAEQLCADDCIVTKNFSLLEPGISARKYYARGVGIFLEIESTGEVVQLVDCNFDIRCDSLPVP